MNDKNTPNDLNTNINTNSSKGEGEWSCNCPDDQLYPLPPRRRYHQLQMCNTGFLF